MGRALRISDYFGLSSLTVGLAYFVSALTTLYLTDGSDGIATVWPASGIAISGLMLVSHPRRTGALVAITLASLAGNWFGGEGLRQSSIYTVANLAEALIGYLCIRQLNRHSDTIYNPVSVVEFCMAAILTGTLSAAIVTLLGGGGINLAFISWVTTVSLGIMIVVPLVISLAKTRAKLMTLKPSQWLKSAAVLLAVGASSYLVFNQTSYPLLFLPLMCVIVTTYLLGPNGAMVSILMIAAIASTETLGHGSGPIHLMRAQSQISATLFLQFYLFILLISALPLAALLGARERVIAQVSRANRWLEMSEQFARVGHWRLDLQNQDLYWSDEVFRIHGLEPGSAPPLEGAIHFYHPEDRPIVELALQELLTSHTPFDFEARLVTADGRERYVHSRGELEHDEKGNAKTIFGIFQDVTQQALTARRLADARLQAEEQADYAMVLAQTDPLTGIANRRNTLSVLDTELAKARENGTPLSLAILDIDHFKNINDNYGHAEGDEVIRRVASLCASAIRSSDFAGRIGGEEFVIILPGSDADTAMRVGERVRASIESSIWPATGPDRVTASIGLATINPQHGADMDAEALLGEADKALYCAKRDGRNLLRAA